MKFFKKTLAPILVLIFMVAACAPKADNSESFLGSLHTAPLSEKVSKQLFLDITHESGNKYLVEGYWISPGTKSGKVSNVFIATNGNLVGPGNDTFSLDANSILHAGGMSYNK